MEELYKLIETGDTWAQEKASIALGIADARARGDITDDEYRELLQDMLRSDVIDAEASDLEIKTMVIQAINAASMVV